MKIQFGQASISCKNGAEIQLCNFNLVRSHSLKYEKSIPLKMEANTQDSGENIKNGATAKCIGKMDPSTKDTGRITAKMA